MSSVSWNMQLFKSLLVLDVVMSYYPAWQISGDPDGLVLVTPQELTSSREALRGSALIKRSLNLIDPTRRYSRLSSLTPVPSVNTKALSPSPNLCGN